jgi:hypothetical protein
MSLKRCTQHTLTTKPTLNWYLFWVFFEFRHSYHNAIRSNFLRTCTVPYFNHGTMIWMIYTSVTNSNTQKTMYRFIGFCSFLLNKCKKDYFVLAVHYIWRLIFSVLVLYDQFSRLAFFLNSKLLTTCDIYQKVHAPPIYIHQQICFYRIREFFYTVLH